MVIILKSGSTAETYFAAGRGTKKYKPSTFGIAYAEKGTPLLLLPADDELLIRVTALSAWTIRPVMMVRIDNRKGLL